MKEYLLSSFHITIDSTNWIITLCIRYSSTQLRRIITFHTSMCNNISSAHVSLWHLHPGVILCTACLSPFKISTTLKCWIFWSLHSRPCGEELAPPQGLSLFFWCEHSRAAVDHRKYEKMLPDAATAKPMPHAYNSEHRSAVREIAE